jgi:hypothetical protein
MWKIVCSLVLQLMPSTACPLAIVVVPVSGAALGTGTPSGPVAPAAGAGPSVPRVLRAASFAARGPPPAAAPPLPVVATIAAAMPPATTSPPAATRSWRRRRRRASSFRIRSIALFLLSLDTATPVIDGLFT